MTIEKKLSNKEILISIYKLINKAIENEIPFDENVDSVIVNDMIELHGDLRRYFKKKAICKKMEVLNDL